MNVFLNAVLAISIMLKIKNVIVALLLAFRAQISLIVTNVFQDFLIRKLKINALILVQMDSFFFLI